MRYRFPIAVLFACAAVLPVAAAAQTPPCLRQIDIYSFDAVPGNRSLVVVDRSRHRYRLNFVGICTGLQYKLGPALQDLLHLRPVLFVTRRTR